MTIRSESKTTRHMYTTIHKTKHVTKTNTRNTQHHTSLQIMIQHICINTQIITNHQKLNNEPTNMFYEPTQNLSTHNKKHVKSAGAWVSG